MAGRWGVLVGEEASREARPFETVVDFGKLSDAEVR